MAVISIQEQKSNRKRLQERTLMMRKSDEQESDVKAFIREIQLYVTIEKLDVTVLNRLISRIVVGEAKKIDGQNYQEVKMIYNFVGEVPDITK